MAHIFQKSQEGDSRLKGQNVPGFVQMIFWATSWVRIHIFAFLGSLDVDQASKVNDAQLKLGNQAILLRLPDLI